MGASLILKEEFSLHGFPGGTADSQENQHASQQHQRYQRVAGPNQGLGKPEG